MAMDLPQQRRFQPDPPLDLATLQTRDRNQQLGGLHAFDTGLSGTGGFDWFSGGGAGGGLQTTTPAFTQVRQPNPLGNLFSDEDDKKTDVTGDRPKDQGQPRDVNLMDDDTILQFTFPGQQQDQ